MTWHEGVRTDPRSVVAPPDAVAATAVLRPLQPPHRILTILEGESLLNDATALLIYRLAVAHARQAVIAMRASNEIGDDAFHRIEEELDWLEMAGRTTGPEA